MFQAAKAKLRPWAAFLPPSLPFHPNLSPPFLPRLLVGGRYSYLAELMLSQPKQYTPVSDFLPFIPALPSIYLPSFSPSLVSPSTTRLFPTDSPHPHLTLCPSHALTDGCMPVPKLHSLPPSLNPDSYRAKKMPRTGSYPPAFSHD